MDGFRVMPTAHLSYDGLRFGQQYPFQAEIEFDCKYISPDEIEIAGRRMNPRRAQAVYDYVTADNASEDGPVSGLCKTIRWFPDDFSSEMPGGVIEEVTTWLAYVLGIVEWDGSYDVWESP